MIGYKMFDRMTPFNTSKQLAEKNIAVGIVVGSIFVGLGIAVGLVSGLVSMREAYDQRTIGTNRTGRSSTFSIRPDFLRRITRRCM
ncbi:MAG: DUF350 domain-containing protein [Deltaproteobacteria bacterium]|nr:DUF350 domain-containing protein [Deltaproteobacteria bacterium]